MTLYRGASSSVVSEDRSAFSFNVKQSKKNALWLELRSSGVLHSVEW
jgi:hypothetical protein